MALGTFSDGGLGMGVAFTLTDHFSQVALRIQNSMASLEGETDKIADRINGAMGKIYAGMAMVGLGVSLMAPLGIGIKAASEFEATSIAFETMLGSAEAAKKVLAEIDMLAVKTPFDITEVEKGYKMLMAYQIPVDMIKDDFTALGNVAAGVNVDIERLVKAFGQVKAKGILKGGEMLQFAEAGVDMGAMLRKIGVEFDLTKKDVADWNISFDQVRQAFRAASAEGGQFHNLMEKLSGTMKGKLANIGDYTTRIFRRLGQAIEPIVTPLINLVLGLLQAFEAFAQTMVGKVVIAILAVSLATVGLGLVIYGLKMIFIALQVAIAPLLATILPYILVMGALAGVMAWVASSAESLEEKMNHLKRPQIFTWMEKAVLLFKGFWAILSSWDNDTGVFMIPERLANALRAAGLWELFQSLGSILVRVTAFFQGVWQGIKDGWAIVKPFVVWMGSVLMKMLTGLFSMFGVDIKKATSDWENWATVGKIVGYAIIGVVLLIAIAFGLMAAAIIIAFSPVILILAAIWYLIQGILSAVNFVMDVFGMLYDAFSYAAQLGYSWGKDVLKGMWEGIKNGWSAFLASLKFLFIDSVTFGLSGIMEIGSNQAAAENQPVDNRGVETGRQKLQEDTKQRSEKASSVNQSMSIGDTRLTVQNILDGKVISEHMNTISERDFYRGAD